jgi:excisionase family DNA binding protein
MSYEGYASVSEVAETLGVSEATVWNLIRDREIERYKFPGDRRTYVTTKAMADLAKPVKLDAPQRGRPRGSAQAKKLAA